MEDKKTSQNFPIDIGRFRKTSDEDFLPPWLFQHDDLIEALESARNIEKAKLINTLNHIHFVDGYVHVLLHHPKYEEEILVKATPDICLEDELTCLWDKGHTNFSLENFQFHYLIVKEQQSITLIPATLLTISNTGFKILLPEKSYAISRRETDRFTCRNVTAELMQSGFLARGTLVDFSPHSFRIKLSPQAPSSQHCFNPDAPATVLLTSNNKMLFSGNCRCIRQKLDPYGWEIVLLPLKLNIMRFQKKKLRHPRRQIFPPPIAIFEHPFFKGFVKLEIFDISIAGFSLFDDAKEGVLMPGMVIHDLSIVYAGELKMKCVAQVLYRQKREEENKIYCGIAILDMDIHSYSRLNRILSLNTDPLSCISTEVDMNALWEFFFDTGFIYPKKYKLLQEHKEEFKNTYRKLYQENPEIAVHFTYEQNGRIYGHMSMIKAYERAWMIHHTAARPLQNKMPGFQVLRQTALFLYGMHHLPSAKMDYIFTYYRPENKFSQRIFGGFVEDLNNPCRCSLDCFSYVTFPTSTPKKQLPSGCSLHESTNSELWELEQYYKHSSGGLFIDVVNPGKRDHDVESLEHTARRLGFIRTWKFFSLVDRGSLKAILIVNQSDVGVNLSELLNSIKILIIDPDNLPWEILSLAIAQLTEAYQLDYIPVMIYPSMYSDNEKISYEKKYQLWILNLLHHPTANQFAEYLQRRFRVNL